MVKNLGKLDFQEVSIANKVLLRCAEEARIEFEDGTIDKNLLVRLYLEYNPKVGDVGLFIDRALELFPNLNCGVSSLYLKEKLKDGMVVNGRYKEEHHTFLLIGDDTIVDITADQYGGPEVYVGRLEYPWGI